MLARDGISRRQLFQGLLAELAKWLSSKCNGKDDMGFLLAPAAQRSR